MARVIWKFAVPFYGSITMPARSRIIDVGSQGDGLFLWAISSKTAEKVTRDFVVFGTGEPIGNMDELTYIGTANTGVYVWHIFERVDV